MRRIRKRMLRRRYLITLDNQEAFSGVLLDADSEFYELTQVRALTREGDAVPVDGTLILERSRILYAQEA